VISIVIAGSRLVEQATAAAIFYTKRGEKHLPKGRSALDAVLVTRADEVIQ
jgi:hypothetical protein